MGVITQTRHFLGEGCYQCVPILLATYDQSGAGIWQSFDWGNVEFSVGFAVTTESLFDA